MNNFKVILMNAEADMKEIIEIADKILIALASNPDIHFTEGNDFEYVFDIAEKYIKYKKQWILKHTN